MKYKLFFSCILLIAIVVRFYKLGSIPSGLTWDEAAIGYNAYGLLTNHRDEWLHRTPIVFQSFGDYKSPLLIYITTIPVAILGLTPLAVRLPIAIAGTGLVIVSFFLTDEILKLIKCKQPAIPYIVMLFVSLSPWAIHYSRVAFESMLACFLICAGLFFILRWLAQRKLWYITLGLSSFVLSMYAYHSAKVFVPILAVFLGLTFYRKFLENKKQIIIAGSVAILLLLPLGYATVFGKANARALSTTILSSSQVTRTFMDHMLIQLSPAFLLHGQDLTYRQSTEEIGVLYPVELLLFVVGLCAILAKKEWRKIWWVPVLFFVGMVPAALGIDVPHSNRSLLALPWAQVTAGIGVMAISNFEFLISKTKKFGTRPAFFGIPLWREILALGILLITGYSFSSYVAIYNKTYSSSTALADFGYGYAEAVAYARSQESSVDKIYFTNHYGQAYIYLLFYKRLTPIEYQGGGLANYVITDDAYADSRGRANTLIIGTPDEFPAGVISTKDIKYPDGNIAFRIVKQ